MGKVDFETRYEKELERKAKSAKRVRELLPIKTRGGLEPLTVEEGDDVEEPFDLPLTLLDLENGSPNGEAELPGEEHGERVAVSSVQSTITLLVNRREKLSQYKLKIGILAASFLEDPENRLKNLDSLLSMLDMEDPSISITVPKLAAVSLLAVFVDVLPNYAIMHHQAPGIKLKSETKERHGYEGQLLRRYKVYLQKVEKLVTKSIPHRKPPKVPVESQLKLGRVGLDCMCKLLVSHPYFNMAVNIVNFVIPFLNCWDESTRKEVHNSIKTVFKSDKRGEISYEIVRRINALMRARMGKNKSANIKCEVLDVLLGLRIKEADLEKEKTEEMSGGKKLTFEQRRMLSKKQRKKSKELVRLEKELLEATAEENKSKKSHYLTEITKLVFTMYFRVIKSNPKHQVLTSVLEGLAKFAHIISIDYFQDLLKILENLLRQDDIHEQQRLLCVATVLAVLEGQGSALTLDPVNFHKYLYATLAKLRCGRPYSHADIAVRCVKLATGRNRMSGLRAVAFAKRVGTTSLQLEHHDAIALLLELKNILRIHSKCQALLDMEGASANGVYLPELDDPDHACAEASNLWELTTLSYHYHPWVRRVVKSITETERVEPLPKEICLKRPEDVCVELNPYPQMQFIPFQSRSGGGPSKRAKHSHYVPRTEYFGEESYLESFTNEQDKCLNKINFK